MASFGLIDFDGDFEGDIEELDEWYNEALFDDSSVTNIVASIAEIPTCSSTMLGETEISSFIDCQIPSNTKKRKTC